MKTEEKDKIKEALCIIKLARQANHITFHAFVDGWPFRKVEKILEEIVGWNEKDESAIHETGKKFKEEIIGKTLKEKSSSLKKILTVGLVAGVTISGVGLKIYTSKKNN